MTLENQWLEDEMKMTSPFWADLFSWYFHALSEAHTMPSLYITMPTLQCGRCNADAFWAMRHNWLWYPQLRWTWPHGKSCTMCMFDYASSDHKVKMWQRPMQEHDCKEPLWTHWLHGLALSKPCWEGQTQSVGRLSENRVSHRAIDQKVHEVPETTALIDGKLSTMSHTLSQSLCSLKFHAAVEVATTKMKFPISFRSKRGDHVAISWSYCRWRVGAFWRDGDQWLFRILTPKKNQKEDSELMFHILNIFSCFFMFFFWNDAT